MIKKCYFSLLNERLYCFCFLKPNSSTEKSIKHVPLVWYIFSDVKPTYFLWINWKCFKMYVLLIYQYIFILSYDTKIFECNIFQICLKKIKNQYYLNSFKQISKFTNAVCRNITMFLQFLPVTFQNMCC